MQTTHTGFDDDLVKKHLEYVRSKKIKNTYPTDLLILLESMYVLAEASSKMDVSYPNMLLVGPKGAGKTSVLTSLAKATGGLVAKVVGHNALMPTDFLYEWQVVYDEKGRQRYEVRLLKLRDFIGYPGIKVFFVDEFDKMNPRSQQSLLEMMAERTISLPDSLRGYKIDKMIVVASANTPLTDKFSNEIPSPLRDRFTAMYWLDPLPESLLMELPYLASKGDKISYLSTLFDPERMRRASEIYPDVRDLFLSSPIIESPYHTIITKTVSFFIGNGEIPTELKDVYEAVVEFSGNRAINKAFDLFTSIVALGVDPVESLKIGVVHSVASSISMDRSSRYSEFEAVRSVLDYYIERYRSEIEEFNKKVLERSGLVRIGGRFTASYGDPSAGVRGVRAGGFF